MLVVGSGVRPYCEYLVRAYAGAARLWLLTDQAPTWESAYVEGHTVALRPGVSVALLARVARTLHARRPFAGVLCWDEGRTLQAAGIAEALGLPGGDPGAILRCRDKHRTRTALAEAGVPSAASRLVGTLDEAGEVARQLGYPLVVKPRGLSASLGVSRVDGPDQLAVAFANACDTNAQHHELLDENVLVEEYLDGPEISCDCALVDGRLTLLVAARKQLGFAPYFEEVGHRVEADDPLRRDARLLDVLTRTHRALAFQNGITHVELRLTADGPKVIEVNGRLGGDLIPYLGWLATGIDPGRAAVDVARGLVPDARASRKQVAAVHFFYASRDVTVAGVDVDEARLPPQVQALDVLAPAGRALRLPPHGHVRSRYALAVVAADSGPACRQALRAAAAAVTLRTADGGSEPARVLTDD